MPPQRQNTILPNPPSTIERVGTGLIRGFLASANALVAADNQLLHAQDERERRDAQINRDNQAIALQQWGLQLQEKGLVQADKIANLKHQLGLEGLGVQSEANRLKAEEQERSTEATLTLGREKLASQMSIEELQNALQERELAQTATLTREGLQSGERIATGAQQTTLAGFGSKERIATGEQAHAAAIASMKIGSAEKIDAQNNAADRVLQEIKARSAMGVAQAKAQLEKAPDDSQIFDQTRQLRQEYLKGAEPYIEVIEQLSRMGSLDALLDPRGIKDDALVRLYHKMLDPTSVVREGEFAGVLEVVDLAGRLIQKYERQADGTLLPPRLRQDIVSLIKNMGGPFLALKAAHEATYTQLAESVGLDPAQIVVQASIPGPAPVPGSPQVQGPPVPPGPAPVPGSPQVLGPPIPPLTPPATEWKIEDLRRAKTEAIEGGATPEEFTQTLRDLGVPESTIEALE